MKRLLLSVATALLCLGSAAAPKGEKIRVIEFDVRQQLPGDKGTTVWFNRRESVTEMVQAETPDVLLMQRLAVPQMEDLRKLLTKYDSYYRHQLDKTEGLSGYGPAIAWRKDRYELVEKGTFWASDTPDVLSKGPSSVPRPTIWVKLKSIKTGRTFLCLSVHLDPGTGERSAQSREIGVAVLQERAKALAGEEMPVFIGGGFASEADSRLIAPLRGWLDNAREKASVTDPAGTFNAYKSTPSGSRPDFILYRGAEPLQYMVLNGKYGTVARFISDHYPVLVNFRMK